VRKELRNINDEEFHNLHIKVVNQNGEYDGRDISTHREMRNAYRISVGKTLRRGYFGDQCVDARIIKTSLS
jgi:hypothetical protein